MVLEAARDVEPAEGFLAGLRELCHRNGALLIMDTDVKPTTPVSEGMKKRKNSERV